MVAHNVYSKRSRKKLDECDERLQAVAEAVLPFVDHSVITGRRSRKKQQKAFDEGTSLARPGQSAHQCKPSMAMDLCPWPIPGEWDDPKNRERFCFLAGYVVAVAASMGIDLVWGGTFKKLSDLGHFEIAGWREEEDV